MCRQNSNEDDAIIALCRKIAALKRGKKKNVRYVCKGCFMAKDTGGEKYTCPILFCKKLFSLGENK